MGGGDNGYRGRGLGGFYGDILSPRGMCALICWKSQKEEITELCNDSNLFCNPTCSNCPFSLVFACTVQRA